ncbi:hypothetical protein L226DRAFT_614220 [Lentinus tigrinus ALCF2SS1-7]|uniref:uncharacterized protein n=1 Tax=Lentinus tigrinus ALCF2SS1-7 TaxID=1328758 RepID=UPI001165FECD|nr:hypothetical protein L226DRAFT_614220 [Lentinus tigrinus ALCF2SS1-7]
MPTSSTTLRSPLDDLFNQASADITLRTSDHVDLHVHTQILSQASPVFSTILSLPQPQACGQAAGAVASDRPVIDVSEDSKTLRPLLRLCYPVDKEVITDLDHIVLVYKVALKYEMDWPLRLLERDDLIGMAPRSPLQVWAIAAQSGAEELARKACSEIRRGASLTSGKSGPDVLDTMLEEDKYDSLQGVRAGDYFRLREYLKDGDDSGHELLQSDRGVPFTYPKRHFVPHISSPDLYVYGRASSDVKHCVHGAILACHSPILADKIDAAKAVQSTTVSATSTEHLESGTSAERHLPVLELDVEPNTLHNLLAVCYKGTEALPDTLSSLAALVAAAGKLGMTQVRALADVAWQTAASENALEAYFVALQHKLESYAATAARKVLEKPLERGWYTSAMESSPAMAYQRLLDYYQACGTEICFCVRSGKIHDCCCVRSGKNHELPSGGGA